MSEIAHDFMSSYSKGELGVQLLKRLVVNNLSETITEFLTLEETHELGEVRKVDMSGIDCYLEVKQVNPVGHGIVGVQVKTEYAVNTFIELVSQVHLDKNHFKIGYALDNNQKSKYTYFINYSNGVAVADTKKLTEFVEEELSHRAGEPIFNGYKYPIKKAYNNYNNAKYLSFGVPVAWEQFIDWDCVVKDWDWDTVLNLLKEDEDGLDILDAMTHHHLANIPPQGVNVEVEQRRKNTDS